jgi:hypothetical protein
MPDPDYRALCAELVCELTRAANGLSNRTANDNHRAWWAKDAYQAADRARAALAQPEPAELMDQELLRLYQVATPCYAVEKYKRELDFARAVLARWGTPANHTRGTH